MVDFKVREGPHEEIRILAKLQVVHYVFELSRINA